MTDFVTRLARKWCESHDQARASAHAAPCICAQLAAAISEVLVEAEKIAKGMIGATRHDIAAAIRALKEDT